MNAPIGIDMTIDQAIAFADEWSDGMTFLAGSQGWRVVCRLLADEVRRQRESLGAWIFNAEAQRDMLDSARSDLDVIRHALGVPVEPHQSLMERMVEAAERGRVPEGWKLVPVESTDAMLDVAVSFALCVQISGEYGWSRYMADVWRRMYSAAPSAPAAPVEPSEVPLPEPWPPGVYLDCQMREYGDAREAVGYALGLKDAQKGGA